MRKIGPRKDILSITGERKKFGGKTYTGRYIYTAKRDATKVAKSTRNSGFPTRVTKMKHNKKNFYGIWTRKK